MMRDEERVEIEIDIKEILEEALADKNEQEDIDEALIRASKKLHGEKKGMLFFQLTLSLLEHTKKENGGTKLENVTKIAQSEGMKVKASLPKSVLAEETTLDDGGMICNKCNQKNPKDANRCISCHVQIEKKKSFLDKLLGR
jgi:ribosomal protein L40E